MSEMLVECVEMLELTVARMASLPGEVARQERRLGNIEGRLEAVEGRLGRVEVQVVQLRKEMHDEFSAVRREFKSELRRELGDLNDTLTARMMALFKESNRQSRALFEDLRQEMRTLFKKYGDRAVADPARRTTRVPIPKPSRRKS